MPRERIGGGEGHPTEVTWSRGGESVQVGTVTVDGSSLPELVERFTQQEGVEASSVMQGLFGHLDRDGCNQLIKVLRRARDQAFGRDE
jgi:hypothetical protein